jgi:hypothetical protein
MPINRLLKDGQHTPEQIELLNNAFNHALNLLSVADRNDPLCEMVARTVIEVGATGTRKPRKIAEVAVALIGLR